MKRTFCCLLSIALLFTSGFSNAESNNSPYILHIWDADILKKWEEILGLDEKLDSEAVKEDKEVLKNLHSDNPPDLFSIEGYELSDYLNEDFCVSFIPSDKMLRDISTMPPIVQQLFRSTIYTKDDRLYAYPESVEVVPMLYWVPGVWKDSPFRNIDPPSCYTELLDFMEIYVNTPHDGFCFDYDLHDIINTPRDWVLRLIKCWTIQCVYNHQDIILNTPEFISLLKRTVELTNKLYTIEPNKKKQQGRQLITTGRFGYTTNGEDHFTWKNMIPWRITSDQSSLVNVAVVMYCARNGSSFSDKVTDLFDCIVDHRQIFSKGEPNYIYYLYLDKNCINVNDWNKQVKKRQGAQAKYDFITQDYVDSIWEIEKYCIPCMVNEYDYIFKVPWEECQDLLTACAAGEISAEDFVVEMDRLAFNSN